MVLVTQKKKPITIHEKRRTGRHHKQSPDYHKPYWPFLPMALIVGLGILANTFWGTIQHHVLSYATDMSVSGLLQETNNQRVGGGLGNLALNAKLNQAAQAKANDMAARDYWSHNTPDGTPPWKFISDAGYEYQTAGENLAYGFDSSTEAVTGWMNSPGHRANVMNTGYTEVGFGIANAISYQNTGQQTIVVAMYASPAVLGATAATSPTPAPTPPASQHVQTNPAGAQPTATPTAQSEPIKQEANATPAPATHESAAPTPTVSTQKVNRLQLLSGTTAAWSTFAASTIATVALLIFFLRHGLLLRRVLIKSERFLIKHPALDIALVAIATIGIILSRTDGIIR